MLRSILLFLITVIFGLQFFSGPAVAAPPSSDLFGQLPNIYDAAISPDGTQIAAIMNNDGQYIIRIYTIGKANTEKPRAVGLGDGVKPSYIKWVNNNRVITAFWQSEKLGSTPFTVGYLYTLDVHAMKGKILIKPDGLFRQFNSVVVDWLEDDPEHILMAFDKESNNDRPDIRRVKVDSGRNVTVERGSAKVQHWTTDHTGKARIGQGRRDNATADWVMRIRLAGDDKWHDSAGFPGLDADVDIHGFTSNLNELIISDYRGKDTVGLYVYDLGAKAITRKIYHNDTYDASGVVLSKDGNEVIGVRYIADTPETELLDGYDTALERMRQKFSDYTVDYVDQSQDSGIVLFKVSGPFDPGYLMMIREGSPDPEIIASLYPGLTSEDLGSVVSVKYTARDGEKIPAYVTLPPGTDESSELKNLPFIILPHGGPYSRDTKRFDYLAQFFATRGYGVLQMNFRGSEGYGKSFEEAGRKRWVVMQEDVEDGTRWLYRKEYADPNRTCIAGWSYGGYAALMGGAKNSDLYNCVIAMAAVTDLKDLMKDMRKYRFGRASAKKFVESGFSDKDEIKANSPVNVAENIVDPLFLAHGTLDQRVHFDQYKRMKSAMKKSKAKVTYMEFKGEDHFLSAEENRKKFFKGLDKFLTESNGKSEFAK